MANLNTPFGFRPVMHLNGNPWNGQGMKCYVDTSNASAMYLGDPVIWDGNACANGCCPQVDLATVGSGYKWMGAIVGIDPTETYNTIYRKASTERYMQVCVDPDVIFETQADGTAAATIVGNNSVIVSGAGSTITGLSGYGMDADVAANANKQLLVMGFVNREDNDLATAYGKWLVLNANHSFRSSITGV